VIGRATLPALVVDELRDRAAIAALASPWEELRAEVAAAGGTRGPFLGPTWFAIYAASLARGRLRVLVAHRAGRLLGLLPLFAERRALAGVPARVLRSLSDDHSQRFDALLRPGEAGEAARALWAHLIADRNWDVLELRETPSGHAPAVEQAAAERPAVERLVACARAAGCPTGSWAAMRSPYLPLPDAGTPLGSAKLRSNLRRRRKKLAAEVGPVALERVDGRDRAALDAALAEGFHLEAAGWKGEAGTAIACDPALLARYRALAHAYAARGELALYFLTAGGRRVAFHFALVDGGVYYLFKPGFDPALASYGLGHLLVDEVACDLGARGVRELDLLGDDLPWKRAWTDRARAHAWRYVFAPTPFGRALAAWKLRWAPSVKRLAARIFARR
jgi:CelD/BcsL family acetyltransferase involved in cellulose biosynthesis